MSALALRLRTEFRGKWGGWLGLVLLIGIFGGATLATAAAARRTDSAYPRFLRATNPFDQFLLTGDLGPVFANVSATSIQAIPQVATVLRSAFFSTTTTAVTPTGDVIASSDPRFDRTFNAAKVVEGTLADPGKVDEAMVPVAIASKIHAHVGGTIKVSFVVADQSLCKNCSPSTNAKMVTLTLKVVGIIAEAGEFPPESDLGPPRIHLTPAFYRANSQRFPPGEYVLVWFHRGAADLAGFRKELTKRFHDKPVIGYTQQALSKNVERSFHLQAVSLGLFAAALAVVSLLVLGQALGRQALTEGVDYSALQALGMTPRQLRSLGAVRAFLVAVAGVALALPVAYLLSPLTPTGLARAAEPRPGFSFDGTAVGLGGVVMILVLLLFVVLPVVRASRLRPSAQGRDDAAERGSRSAAFAARAGASAPAVVGIRLALEPGRGRTAVPVRTTITGVALAVAAIVLSLGFGSSLHFLLKTPRLYGVTWSADAQFADDDTTNRRSGAALAAAQKESYVEAAGYAALGIPLLVDGVQADSLALPSGERAFFPEIQVGRAPKRRGEIVLGPKTIEQIHKNVGDRVMVGTVGVEPSAMTIVGRSVLPTVGHSANLGEGALITFDSIGAFVPGASTGDLPRDEFLVRFKSGVDSNMAREKLRKALASFGAQVNPLNTPADLLSFGRSKNLPYLLSGMLAALALATLGHAMFSAVNRRRRDLAILKTMGFTRGDTGRAIAWQSTTFIAVALAVGIVGGAAAGRWLWTVYANGLGIIAEPRVPVATYLAIVPIGVLIANGLALIPGRVAARTRPALVLRTE